MAHFGLGKILFCISLYWVYWLFIQPVKTLGGGKKNEVARSVPELRAKKDYLSLGLITKLSISKALFGFELPSSLV